MLRFIIFSHLRREMGERSGRKALSHLKSVLQTPDRLINVLQTFFRWSLFRLKKVAYKRDISYLIRAGPNVCKMFYTKRLTNVA